MELFIYLDLFGTLIFAITGAFKAVKYELDVLGVIVLATFTGVGGGLIRDIILDVNPPFILQNELYLLICLLGALIVFFAASKIAITWPIIKIGDAIGLGVFTVLGAWKGLDHNLGPLGIILIATLSAVGGGVIRDLFVNEIPSVIRTDFYATASALGAIIFYFFAKINIPLSINMITVFIIVTTVRILAIIFKISLPKVKKLPKEPSEIARDKLNFLRKK